MVAQSASPLIIPLTAAREMKSWGDLSNPFLSIKSPLKVGGEWKGESLSAEQTDWLRQGTGRAALGNQYGWGFEKVDWLHWISYRFLSFSQLVPCSPPAEGIKLWGSANNNKTMPRQGKDLTGCPIASAPYWVCQCWGSNCSRPETLCGNKKHRRIWMMMLGGQLQISVYWEESPTGFQLSPAAWDVSFWQDRSEHWFLLNQERISFVFKITLAEMHKTMGSLTSS